MLTRCIKVSKLKTSFIISRERKKKEGGKFPVSSSSPRTRRIMKFRRKLVDCPDKGDQAGIKIYQKVKRSLLLERKKKKWDTSRRDKASNFKETRIFDSKHDFEVNVSIHFRGRDISRIHDDGAP